MKAFPIGFQMSPKANNIQENIMADATITEQVPGNICQECEAGYPCETARSL